MNIIVCSPDALANLTLAPELLPTAHIHLKLLLPLTYKDVLDQNRAPETRVMRNSSGEIIGPSNHEYLHLENLGKSWRQPWSRFYTNIRKVTFDLSTERVEGEDRVMWTDELTMMDGKIEVNIDHRAIILLLSTLGTVMHMRSKRNVEMEVLPPKGGEEHWKLAISVVEEAFEALRTGGRSHEEKKEAKRRKREES